MREFCYRVWQSWGESNLPGVIGAIFIMLVGWLIALWLAGKVTKVAGKCMTWGKTISGDENEVLADSSGSVAGKVTFYAVMLLVVLAAMSLLRLEYAAVPLREFVTIIAGYLPNVVGALLLLLLAWFIAGVVRNVVSGVVKEYDVAENMEKHFSIEQQRARKIVVNGVTFLVYLFFLPAILNALKIYGITAPLQTMFEVILLYLPRFAAAMVIFFVGLWAAKVVRNAVETIMLALRMDNFCKWCGVQSISLEMPAKVLGWVAWLLVIIPVVTGTLHVLGIAALSRPVADFLALLLAGSGSIIGAGLVVLFAFVVGRILAGIVTAIASACGVDNWMEKLGFKHDKLQEFRLSAFAGKVVLIAAVVFGLLGACDVLELVFAASLIRQLALFGGNLIVSLIILLAGVAAGNFTSDITRSKLGVTAAGALKCAIILLAVTVALSNLQLGRMVVEIAFLLLLGALCAAFALAFGLGGREFAARVLDKWREKMR